jgi:tetratricopeptide (TPR) repeat protein
MKRIASLFVLLVLAIARPLPAHAQSHEEGETRARRLFAVGRYAEALDIYSRLYAETGHPTYMRNIGRCFQSLGEPDKAIGSFREYLRQVPELPPEQRAQVEGYIREMQELKHQRASQTPPPATAPVVTPAPAPSAAVATTPEPATPLGARRTGALVAAGGTVVGLAIGTVFGLRAIARRSDSDPHCPRDVCDARGYQLDREAHTAALISDVAVAAGLLSAGLATYLFLTSGDAARPSEITLQVRPPAGRHPGGVLLGATF